MAKGAEWGGGREGGYTEREDSDAVKGKVKQQGGQSAFPLPTRKRAVGKEPGLGL